MISFFSEDIVFNLSNKLQSKRWIKNICEQYEKGVGDINYIFCSDDYILEINKKYLNHHYFTDIITFNYNEDDRVSGDIFVSIDTVKSNAIEFDTTFDNELRRVMIHGILHLVGFNDKTDEDKLVMRQKENEALDKFPL